MNQQNQPVAVPTQRDPTPEQRPVERADPSREQVKDNQSRKSLKHSQKSHLSKLVSNPARQSEFLKAAMKMSEKNLLALDGRAADQDPYRPVGLFH